MVSVAVGAAALMPAAFGHWLWEVELDVPLHQEGILVVQARQKASLAVVQRQHAVEIYLLGTIKDLSDPNDIRHKFSFTSGYRNGRGGNTTILYLLVEEQVQFAGAEYPVPAFSGPH